MDHSHCIFQDSIIIFLDHLVCSNSKSITCFYLFIYFCKTSITCSYIQDIEPTYSHTHLLLWNWCVWIILGICICIYMYIYTYIYIHIINAVKETLSRHESNFGCAETTAGIGMAIKMQCKSCVLFHVIYIQVF